MFASIPNTIRWVVMFGTFASCAPEEPAPAEPNPDAEAAPQPVLQEEGRVGKEDTTIEHANGEPFPESPSPKPVGGLIGGGGLGTRGGGHRQRGRGPGDPRPRQRRLRVRGSRR